MLDSSVDLDPDSATGADFRTLYRRYYRLVWWVIRGSGVPEAWIEDVAHDVFLTIYRRLPERDDDTAMRPWVIGIARNAAFSHRRGAARRKARHGALLEPDPPSAVDSVVAYRQAWDQVHNFLSELEAEQREAFVMCDLQGVAPAEVATALQVSRNTVYSRLRLARSKLVDHFSERPRRSLPGLVRAARSQGQPTRANKQRTWAALALQLPLHPLAAPVAAPTPVAASPGLLGSWTLIGKSALISLGLAAVTVGAIAAVGRMGVAEPSTAIAETEGSGPRVDPGHRDESERRDEPGEPTLEPAPPEVTTTMARSADTSRARPSPTAPLRSSTAPTSARHTAPNAEPNADSTLDAEVALLGQATAQLQQGDATKALATLDRHAREHPESVLSNERLGLQVKALCATGKTDRARAIATRFVAEHPNSRLAAALADPCAE